jgi:glycopeptide antibiotics resistance protein
MKQVILQAIQDGLPLILFGAIAYLLFRLLRRKNIDAKPSLIREGLWLLFVLYTLFLLSVTVIPHWRFVLTITGKRRLTFFVDSEKTYVNIMPFQTIKKLIFGYDQRVDDFHRIGIMNVIGNALIYLPLGFVGVIAWFDVKRISEKLFFGGLIMCLFVEFIQYFVGRSPDVDDVILNMTGLLVGICLGNIVRVVLAKKMRKI